MRLGSWVLAVACVVGCGDALESVDLDETDSLLPPPDEPASGNVPLGEPCQESSDCVMPGICAAPWDGSSGTLVCASSCVENGDESRWCSDDSACCDADATCGPRGLCEAGGAVDESGGGSSSSTGGDGTGTTGASTGGSGMGSTGEAASSSSGGSSTG